MPALAALPGTGRAPRASWSQRHLLLSPDEPGRDPWLWDVLQGLCWAPAADQAGWGLLSVPGVSGRSDQARLGFVNHLHIPSQQFPTSGLQGQGLTLSHPEITAFFFYSALLA